MENNRVYDVLIIGGGPAGMNAAIYAVRSGLDTIMVEKGAFGGQIVDTYEIKNYLGFKSINGAQLAQQMREQVSELGVEILSDSPKNIDLKSDIKSLTTLSGKSIQARTVILSMGAAARKLGLDNEDQLRGKGVSYCAICDGAFFKDAVVAVNGGGNTALEDAMYLNKIAKKVYLIHRRDNFRADQIIIDDLNRTLKSPDNKIEIIYDSVVKSINGKNMLESITVFNKKTNKEKNIKLDGFFIAIGRTPSTELVKGQVELTYDGYIKTNQHLETNVKGVYAAGDIREKEVRQIITAASDGAVASTYASSYLRKIKK